MIVILSGSSGAGKNTIIGQLIAGEPDTYAIMPTVTTRAPREGEREGEPYYFVSKEEFMRRAAAGEFYEYETVHGNLYGTSKSVLHGMLRKEKILLKDIDVFGTLNLTDKLSGTVKIVTVFIAVGLEKLRERLRARGEKESDIERRLLRYTVEQAFADKYDYKIENDDLGSAVSEIKKIMERERNK